MKKIKKIWRAFCHGFWRAWLELPPQKYHSVGELQVTLTCDTTQFDRSIDETIERLRELQKRASHIGRYA